MQNENYDVLIIGGGPAGLTSAIYTARADLTVLVIAGDPPGGQLMWTSEVENFPGFDKSILGPDLINNMKIQELLENNEKATLIIQKFYMDKLVASLNSDIIAEDYKEFVRAKGFSIEDLARIIDSRTRSTEESERS